MLCTVIDFTNRNLYVILLLLKAKNKEKNIKLM